MTLWPRLPVVDFCATHVRACTWFLDGTKSQFSAVPQELPCRDYPSYTTCSQGAYRPGAVFKSSWTKCPVWYCFLQPRTYPDVGAYSAYSPQVLGFEQPISDSWTSRPQSGSDVPSVLGHHPLSSSSHGHGALCRSDLHVCLVLGAWQLP